MKLEDLNTGDFSPQLISKVKRVEDTLYELTVKPPPGSSLMICSACGRRDACKMFKQYMGLKAIVDKQTDFEVLRCSAYLPVIQFTDFKGVEGDFNTFRYNTAWASRLIANTSMIRLVKGNQYEGLAVVENIFTGTLKSLLADHARFNHLMKGEENAEEKLTEVLQRQYGGFIRGNGSIESAKFTVIYMKRIDAVSDKQQD